MFSGSEFDVVAVAKCNDFQKRVERCLNTGILRVCFGNHAHVNIQSGNSWQNSSSTIAPSAGIEPTPLRCQCANASRRGFLAGDLLFMLEFVQLCVHGLNFDMCMISTYD